MYALLTAHYGYADHFPKPKRYNFGDEPGPQFAQPVYDIAGYRKQGDLPKHMDHALTNGTIDDQTARRIKRKKEQRRVNGDAMDLDDGYGQSDQPSETDSPAPAVQDIPLLDTLAITEDRSVSTEKPRDIFPNSSFLDLPSGTSISHSVWSPDDPAPLLVGGTNCLRLYGIKNDSSSEAIHRDIEVNSSEFDVVALSWLGESDAAASISEKFDPNDQTSESSARLLYISHWGSSSKVLSTLSGTVFALQYNPTSKMLLAISASASTTISIYQIGENSAPLCSKELHENDLFDAAWMTPTKFIACGTNILQIYEVTSSEIRLLQTHGSMSKAWFRIKYDPVCQIAAMVDEEMSILRQYNVSTEDTRTQAFDATMTDFAFQPIVNASAFDATTQPRILATSTDDGVVRLWDARNPFTCLHRLSVPVLGDAVTMKQIAFSPDGYFLAGAGFDTVAVWRTEDGGQPRALWRCTDQEVWRSLPAEPGESEGEGEDEWVHALSWDADGHKLVFSLKDQVCYALMFSQNIDSSTNSYFRLRLYDVHRILKYTYRLLAQAVHWGWLRLWYLIENIWDFGRWTWEFFSLDRYPDTDASSLLNIIPALSLHSLSISYKKWCIMKLQRLSHRLPIGDC